MTFVITQSCCNDASCVAVCPVDCIHPAPDEPGFADAEMLYIHPDECIDCGACVEACPVSAVHADIDLPGHLSDYVAINADFFDWVGSVPEPKPLPESGPRVEGQTAPLRVAVVGAGPAGWFVADELTSTRRADVEVTVLDRRPTPHGLVRYGVAPDHLRTKDIATLFDGFARHVRTTLRLNVDVGRDVTHDDLLDHHHAVVYATGAAEGRTLSIPGEELPGSYSAAEFVAWYNAEPGSAHLAPPLDHERAVIIGNGNVALDMARLLLTQPDELHAATDAAPRAVEALAGSGIREVVVVGRRGPEHAAFTSPELLALINNPDIDVIVDSGELSSTSPSDQEDRTAATYAAHLKASLLRRAATSPTGSAKRLVLRFGRTPQAILGDDKVRGLIVRGSDGGVDETETIEAGLVLRATGHRSTRVGDVPFDNQAGRFAHQEGRVSDPSSGVLVPATYTTGWAKRGATGVIGDNRACAVETASALLDDYGDERLSEPSGNGKDFDALLTERGVEFVDLEGWRRLDDHERRAGESTGRPRVKISDHDELIRIAVGS